MFAGSGKLAVGIWQRSVGRGAKHHSAHGWLYRDSATGHEAFAEYCHGRRGGVVGTCAGPYSGKASGFEKVGGVLYYNNGRLQQPFARLRVTSSL
jgi:hypothetical protein